MEPTEQIANVRTMLADRIEAVLIEHEHVMARIEALRGDLASARKSSEIAAVARYLSEASLELARLEAEGAMLGRTRIALAR
jgi:hypothetical protein